MQWSLTIRLIFLISKVTKALATWLVYIAEHNYLIHIYIGNLIKIEWGSFNISNKIETMNGQEFIILVLITVVHVMASYWLTAVKIQEFCIST